MEILPIKLISEEDQAVFGANLFNLAKLERADLPVAMGIAVSPPEIIINTLLQNFDLGNREIFEQSLTLVKERLLKTPIPEELIKELKYHQSFYLKGNLYHLKDIWPAMLGIWLGEIRALIWQRGFSDKLTSELSPLTVLFIKKKSCLITAYFDPQLDQVVIKSDSEITPKYLKQIDETVLAANRKLFLPQIYQMLIHEQILVITGLTPYTQLLPVSKKEEIVIPVEKQRKLVKSAIKLFLNLSEGFAIDESADGVLIEGKNELKLSSKEDGADFDKEVFKLSEAALSFPNASVIYQLPNITDHDIGGTLRLLHQPKILDQACDLFLFVRNKKSLLNLELSIPQVRSVSELQDIKKELAARHLSRSGALKLWVEMEVPENFINLEDYLQAGFDGAIINLDILQKHLSGFEQSDGEFYKQQIKALLKFLIPAVKMLHHAQIPILVKGELSVQSDILDFLVENGVWGVIVNTAVKAAALPSQLVWSERRAINRRFE